MTEPTNPDRVIADGVRARALLTDPLMASILGAMRTALVEQFYGTAPEDAKTRELLHHLHGAQRRFEQAFVALISAADIESAYRNEELMRLRASEQIDQHIRSR